MGVRLHTQEDTISHTSTQSGSRANTVDCFSLFILWRSIILEDLPGYQTLRHLLFMNINFKMYLSPDFKFLIIILFSGGFNRKESLLN